jgi:hypothetical protein
MPPDARLTDEARGGMPGPHSRVAEAPAFALKAEEIQWLDRNGFTEDECCRFRGSARPVGRRHVHLACATAAIRRRFAALIGPGTPASGGGEAAATGSLCSSCSGDGRADRPDHAVDPSRRVGACRKACATFTPLVHRAGIFGFAARGETGPRGLLLDRDLCRPLPVAVARPILPHRFPQLSCLRDGYLARD